MLTGRLLIVLVLQHDAVFLHTDHVGMEARDLDESAVRSRRDAHLNVKHIVLIRTPDGERRLLQIGADGLYLLRRELLRAPEAAHPALSATMPAAAAAAMPRRPFVFGTMTLLTFLMMFALASTSTVSGSAPSVWRASAAQ